MTADFDANRIDLAREGDFRLGEILVRPSTRQVEAGGRSQTLQPRIMQVLVALVRRRGQVVSREELTQTCWQGRAVGEDAINRCIQQIRKLGETTSAFEVETIPRVGYRLWSEQTTAGTHTAEAVVRDSSRTKKPAWVLRLPVLSGVAILAIVLASATWLAVQNSKTVEVRAPPTLAVLPFDAPAEVPEARRVADAVVPAIAYDLSRSGISVVSTTRSAQYGGPYKASAAADLNARFLVSGSVQVDAKGAHVFVTVEHARRGMTLWSARISGPAEDPQLVADRVSVQVGRVMGWSGVLKALDSNELDGALRAAAFLLVIQRAQNGDGLGAVEAARAMIRIAPDDPEAVGALAIETINALPQMELGLRMAALEEARSAAKQARDLDPRGGDSVMAQYNVLHPAKWAERIRVLVNGQKLVPRESPPVVYESVVLFGTGQVRLAATASARARSTRSRAAR